MAASFEAVTNEVHEVWRRSRKRWRAGEREGGIVEELVRGVEGHRGDGGGYVISAIEFGFTSAHACRVIVRVKPRAKRLRETYSRGYV